MLCYAKTNDSDCGYPLSMIDIVDDDMAGWGNLIEYLNTSPRNAIHVGIKDANLGATTYAIWRGASEKLNNFYYGLLPLEDPGDVDGGDLDAATALDKVLGILNDNKHLYYGDL